LRIRRSLGEVLVGAAPGLRQETQIWAGAQPPSNCKPGTLQKVPLFCSALRCHFHRIFSGVFYVLKLENKLNLSDARQKTMSDDSHLLPCGKVRNCAIDAEGDTELVSLAKEGTRSGIK
jgi:hypothetical protein